MIIQGCYTKHGRDRHLMDVTQTHEPGKRLRTLCGHDAYALWDRSWFWRRRLKMASTCWECATGPKEKS